MKSRMFKRMVSLWLVLILCISLVPATAYAAGRPIVINNDALYTSNDAVDLTLDSDVYLQMIVSSNSDFSGASWESVPRGGHKTWTLPHQEGNQSVYIKFRFWFFVWIESNTYSDSIYHDITAPTYSSTSKKANDTGADFISTNNDYTVCANNVRDEYFTHAKSVKFVTREQRSGLTVFRQTGTKTDFNFYCNIPLNYFNNQSGTYITDIYISDYAGNLTIGESVTAVVDTIAPAAPAITSPPNQSATASTVVSLKGTAERDSTILVKRGGILVGQGTTQWDGNFSVSAALTANSVNAFSVTARDTAGNESTASTISITQDSMPPAATLTTKSQIINADAINIKGTTEAGATVTIKGGKSTAKGTAGKNGSFNLYIQLKQNQKNYINASFCDANGNIMNLEPILITEDSNAPTITGISTPKEYTAENSFTVYAEGVADSVSGIASVKFPTWTAENGQDDIVWHEGKYDSASGRWYYTVNKSEHNNETGAYVADAYAYDKAGNAVCRSRLTVNIDQTAPTIAAIAALKEHTAEDSFIVYAEGVADSGSGIASVKFPTWTAENGQDDIVWHEGKYDSVSGRWYCTVNKSEHNNGNGIYVTDVYAYDKAGNSASKSRVTVTVDPPAPDGNNAETPTITAQPEGMTVLVGGNGGLPVFVYLMANVSQGTLTYQWYRNTTNSNSGGMPIEGASGVLSEFGAKYIVPTDTAGIAYYYCIVTNTDNTVTGNPTASIVSNVAVMTVVANG